MSEIVIRTATWRDQEAIWKIIAPIIAAGDTYCFPPDSTKEEMLGYWCNSDKFTYVATIDDQVMGTFIIKDNQPGLGSHVANASYMTAPGAAGKGIGSKMCEYSLEEARRLQYHAMQFNIVIKSNERAVRLWQRFGFEIVGEVPEVFQHARLGLTGAYVMWRRL